MSAFKDKVLPFAKSYGLMIGLGTVAMVALPAAFFFAQGMNSSYTEEVQRQVSQEYGAVTASTNTFSLPGLSGDKVLEQKADYNAERIGWYAERWKETKERTGVVWEQGLKFNKADHELFVQGLFPAPPDLEKEVKIRELVGAVIEFHKKLLEKSKAGAPIDAPTLTAVLADYRAQSIERIKAQRGGADLDPAEKDEISKELLDLRVDRCRKRAMELNVYADAGVFEGIPLEVPTKAPSLGQAWELQEHSWIDSDIMRAIGEANKSTQTGIVGAVVKRISKITVKPPTYDPANPSAAPFEPGEDKAPTDLSRRLSGRISGPGTKNKWYDVRDIDLDMIVSSQRLPEFIDALAAANFMTVLDLDLTAVSTRDDLRQGYFYGDEHVVRAHVQVELVLLREWRKEWMPEEVRKALGAAEGVQGEGSQPGGTSPKPRPGGPGGPGGGGGGRRPAGG